MIYQTFKDIYDEELAKGAKINDRYPGFVEDYLLLHILLKKYNPKTFFEVGTNTGWGTSIIITAIPDATVYSLDLSDEQHYKSLQHPISEGKRGKVGHECLFPFIQLWGDSTTFDYSQYPCEGYYCDAEHSEQNVFAETMQMLNQKPILIIWHDTDSPEVMAGIKRAFSVHDEAIKYYLYRVSDTRISYAYRKMEKNND